MHNFLKYSALVNSYNYILLICLVDEDILKMLVFTSTSGSYIKISQKILRSLIYTHQSSNVSLHHICNIVFNIIIIIT